MNYNPDSLHFDKIGLITSIICLFILEFIILYNSFNVRDEIKNNTLSLLQANKRFNSINGYYLYIVVLLCIIIAISFSQYFTLNDYDFQTVMPICIPIICIFIPISIIMYVDSYLKKYSVNHQTDEDDDKTTSSKINNDYESKLYVNLILYHICYVIMTVLFIAFIIKSQNNLINNESMHKTANYAIITSIFMVGGIEVMLFIIHTYVRNELLDRTDG